MMQRSSNQQIIPAQTLEVQPYVSQLQDEPAKKNKNKRKNTKQMSITDVGNTSHLMVVLYYFYCLEHSFEKDMISTLHQRLDMLHLLGGQLFVHMLPAHIEYLFGWKKKSSNLLNEGNIFYYIKCILLCNITSINTEFSIIF